MTATVESKLILLTSNLFDMRRRCDSAYFRACVHTYAAIYACLRMFILPIEVMKYEAWERPNLTFFFNFITLCWLDISGENAIFNLLINPGSRCKLKQEKSFEVYFGATCPSHVQYLSVHASILFNTKRHAKYGTQLLGGKFVCHSDTVVSWVLSPEYCGSFIHREQTIWSFLLKGLNFFLFMEKGVVSNFFAIVYREDENIYVVSSLASDKQIEVNLWSVRRRVQLWNNFVSAFHIDNSSNRDMCYILILSP